MNFFNPIKQDNNDFMFFFNEEYTEKIDDYRMNDFKSTEENSSKMGSSMSVLAEDNFSISEKSTVITSFENELDNLAFDIQSKINNGRIENLVDEALDNVFDGTIEKFRPIQHKTKKTSAQNDYLDQALKECSEWEKPHMQNIADKLGLSYRQVYKWYWDKIKKTQNKCNKKVKHNKFEDIETTFSTIMN
eukprot:CAMPEP_0205808150 /NCGR_PEP_ID=MMETSP0205-20121125/12029_1 /ASSEMBLY_ACC=CAM_ASM_000278 /TAXON_ID=36767 /ORGANISM="Euplotes focardii, Strain TN1" /LENGTH=189 /DNA_ID=CAMNT_0053083391 /DNA_START=41 /DNA_END=610 /DNA_ORIENTATION=+